MRNSSISVAIALRMIVNVMLSIVSLFMPSQSEAAGPWKGQIVDKETGQPIEGAVVLAVLYKATGIFHTTGGSEYYDSEEVVTDAEGRFYIQARQTWTLNPFSRIWGPEFYIFKSGFGKWQFRDFDKWGLGDAMISAERTRAEWRRLTTEGTVLELPPLKTREARVNALNRPLLVPPEWMPKFMDAFNKERINLGFDPINSKQGS
jgi:hypothetical protein